MGDQPDRYTPFLLGGHHLNDIVIACQIPRSKKPDPCPVDDRIFSGALLTGPEGDQVFGYRALKPLEERRARCSVIRAHETVPCPLALHQGAVLVHILTGCTEAEAHREKLLNHVVGFLRLAAGPDRHMGLPIFEAQNTVIGHKTHFEIRVLFLKPHEDRCHDRRHDWQRCHDQLAGHL